MEGEGHEVCYGTRGNRVPRLRKRELRVEIKVEINNSISYLCSFRWLERKV